MAGTSVPRGEQGALRISLLGPVRAWGSGGEVDLGSAQRRAVLAVLALRLGQTVSKSELVDAVWGDGAPASAQASVYAHISRLRATFEPHRQPRTEGTLLTSAGSGYRLALPGDSVDVDSFEALRNQARTCRNNRDTTGELAALEAALALWDGKALDNATGPFAARQRARLSGLKLDVVERRARILLNMGRAHALVDELHELTREAPARESLFGLLMQALYLSGRRQAAIGVFQRLRASTVERLGTEPGTALSTLHEKILRDDPSLRWTVDGVPGRTRPIPLLDRNTSPSSRRLIGRERESEALRAAGAAVASGTGGVVWLQGELGIGKTALLSEAVGKVSGVQVAWCTANELGQGVPLRALIDGLDVTRSSPDPARSSIAAAVRELGPEAFDERHPGAEKALVAMLDLVRALCADGPLILVVDQLQWADPLTLAVVRRLAGETSSLPLLVVLALRTLPRRPEIDQTRSAVTDVLEMHLGPLASTAVHELVTGLVGAEPGPKVLELARQAAGNPLLLVVLLEFLVSGKVLQIDGGRADLGKCSPPPNNASIVDVISDHLQTVPAEIRELLGWAALCGQEFSAAEVVAVLEMPAEQVEGLLDDAVAGGFLAKSCTGASYYFRHKMIQRAFYGRHTAPVRGSLHRQIAQAWAGIDVPAHRIGEQLMLSPQGSDSWSSEWVNANAGSLLARAPQVARPLLQRVLRTADLPQTQRRDLAAELAASTDESDPISRYWAGDWDSTASIAPIADPTAGEVRLARGTEALICAHRDQPDVARDHLSAVRRSTRGTDPRGSGVVLAARATLAELRGDPAQACDILAELLDEVNEESVGWLPRLARVAQDQGRRQLVERATASCDRLPAATGTALQCRALLDGDAALAFAAAYQHKASGRLVAYASAMEDGAVLLAAQGNDHSAEPFAAALAIYQRLGARWELRRANDRRGKVS